MRPVIGLGKNGWDKMSEKSNLRPRAETPDGKAAHGRDELGPNSEIGSKLKALYTSIQEETIPERFLDLLEKLDQAERGQSVSQPAEDAQINVPVME
ncbi:hypothetical protein GCM10011491_25670 [Brucella endophytica]|uniref:Anti-sigma factor NepR domain-containing protein n=2 Tax=Brucella endophytica TaxID=1963359 RepID=A0A916WH00_9HYPH|nr:hypothetical protein GCM10011491_25670 [Brucella endophytica]